MTSPLHLVLLFPVLLLIHTLTTYLLNPLRRVPPAHPLAPFTRLWILSVRWRGIENATLKAAHARLGPVVCLSPAEVSVNCVVGGIREVYGGGMEKGNGSGYCWYGFFANYGGIDNMFTIGGNKAHSTRKRIISNIYSKSVVTTSPVLFAQVSAIIYERFLPRLQSVVSTGDGVFNIYDILHGMTMDIVTGYIFGLQSSSNLVSNPEELTWFLGLYNSRRSYNFWPQELPQWTDAVQKWLGYHLSPQWVDEANGNIEKWTMAMCKRAAAAMQKSDLKPQDTPVVYQQLRAAVAKEAAKMDNGNNKIDVDLTVASEVLDHLAAGFDTSGITLTYIVHELSRHPEIQSRLQEELQTLSPPIALSSAPKLPDPKVLDALPLLHAVTWETLRLHSAIPGPQPRFTPPQGARLGPAELNYYVPGNVRVSASAGLLHLNEDVYDHAEEWRPQRWLEEVSEEKRKDMESRWFWAFGSGGRMCVGSHLAVYQMKYIIAALYSNYTTIIVDDTGIEQSDSYTAPPKSDKFLVKLVEHVKTG
ncbi:cytochrome P450 [Aaosphaeria arxii CBS 175.79]|uniref:Cytochrome P450 n=1 Tax=Aaosphaeria arxii CBS 175.79 TaxID=1450172 RepID=A0A6A5Y5B4_9PLEO|nr:cytochrome P450 [Aaosphaeria arxii CBS 175.79]KAF2020745.1 cytochrome P450 [Aaosphaeria arxii CBS 175.79]